MAAVFDAFLTLYKSRIADLLRIASEGTGVLPAGQLHPDLVHRLADEASRSARHVLDMCIRALDYCPPVDLTFGDYLRAIVTADFEYDPVDEEHRRVAFVEAFRRHGIIPDDVRTLSVDGLLWRATAAAPDEDENVVLGLVKAWTVDIAQWNLSKSRRELFELMRDKRAILHTHITQKFKSGSAVLGGIDPTLRFEVHSLRPSIRTDWEGLEWKVQAGHDTTVVTTHDLLARTVLYKVGHHGSHNATLREKGLELMTSDKLVAMIPVSRRTAQKMDWKMPFPSLLRRLQQKTGGRILDLDEGTAAENPGPLTQQEWQQFIARTDVQDNWIDYNVPL